MTGLLATTRGVTILAFLLGVSAKAMAQPSGDILRARELFQEALSLEVAGDYATALMKLQQVASVRFTPQVRYHLARCKENLGRLTEALGDYRVAATEARDADLDELGEFERALAALEKRVPRLKVVVRATKASTIVELDGVRVGAGALAEPIPVDPGPRRVVLRDGDRALVSETVTAVEGQTVEVRLEPQTAPEPEPSAGLAGHAEESGQGAPTWAYVAGSIGVLGVASSVALWIVRSQAISELSEKCEGDTCPESLRGTYNRGRTASWLAPVAGSVGAVGLGLSVWGFWRGSGRDQRHRAELSLALPAFEPYAGVRVTSEF